MTQAKFNIQPGDEIRIIAPSSSWDKGRADQYKLAIDRFETRGYKIKLSKNLRKKGLLGTATIQERIEDLHDAYLNSDVKAILCLNGGWSANELLDSIDWKIIRENPKPLVGYSDITILHNAIYAKTKQPGVLAPNLGTLGHEEVWEYSLNNLLEVLRPYESLKLLKSEYWQDYDSPLIKNDGWICLNSGTAKGVMVGGNAGTLYLLQGTEYMPTFEEDTILLIEDDDESGEYTGREFDRRLESLLQQKNTRQNIKGVIVGRFQLNSSISSEVIEDILTRKFGTEIPIAYNVDFGHTQPSLALPIGRGVMLDTSAHDVKIELR